MTPITVNVTTRDGHLHTWVLHEDPTVVRAAELTVAVTVDGRVFTWKPE